MTGLAHRDWTQWERSALCAALTLALPECFGGIVIKAHAGLVRRRWLEAFKGLVPDKQSLVTIPVSVAPDRLHTSLSLARSVSLGRPIYRSGLLEEAAGGAAIITMAERLDGNVAAHLTNALDTGAHSPERAICTIFLDESDRWEDGLATLLRERLAFEVSLNGVRSHEVRPFSFGGADINSIKRNFAAVEIASALIEQIDKTCLSVGALSLRVPLFCLQASKALAALEGANAVLQEHVELACGLVLSGRALVPAGNEQASAPPPPDRSEPEDGSQAQDSDEHAAADAATLDALENQLIKKVQSAYVSINSGDKRAVQRQSGGVSGRSGDLGYAHDRGRPDRLTAYRSGLGRIDVMGTLRAAAPMQKIRGRTTPHDPLRLSLQDLRSKRYKRRRQSSVIFVVDASGSSAIHRLAEAKGAVETLLSQCYARRDLVSLITFCGAKSEVILQPTRSLVRAQRTISDLAGGGATPLAHALATAAELAKREASRGRTPFMVFMSDGRGNVTLEGEADRARSAEQALALARGQVHGQFQSVYFDISRRPDPRSQALSNDLGAQYEFLPTADAGRVSSIVRDHIGTR